MKPIHLAAGLLAFVATASASVPAPEAATSRPTASAPAPVQLLPATKILALPAGQAYAESLQWLVTGKQSQTEAIVDALASKYPKDQQIAFAKAVLTRSRFDVQAAAPLFLLAQNLDPKTPIGKCSALILAIDLRRGLDTTFPALMELTQSPGADPMILWLGGIACRTLNQNAAGVECYRALLQQWNPAPVLVHQTFANLLDEVRQYDQALVHRRLAVQMEPAGWSYEGMALTLGKLNRFQEADKAFARSVELSPKMASYYDAWANMLNPWHHPDEAIAKARIALSIYDNDPESLNAWGLALMQKGQFDAAAEKFQLCLKVAPKFSWAYGNLAIACENQGHTDQALTYYKAAIDIAPTASNYLLLADLYTRTGRFNLVEEAFSHAQAADPKVPSVLVTWAQALLETHPADAALKCRQALALDSNSAPAMFVLGKCLEAAAATPADIQAAVVQYRAAIHANPAYWQPYIRLADLLKDPADAAESDALRKKGSELHDQAGL